MGSPSNPMLGEVTRMLVWGLMLLRSKLFYCLRLPIQSNARGGDQNASLGINAAYCPLFYRLQLPIQSNSRQVVLHVKKNKFRGSKSVVFSRKTTSDPLSLSCLPKGQIWST